MCNVKVLILGAGISGLSLAWYLKRYGDISSTLIDRAERVGGAIQSIEKEGFLFEQGPHSCRSGGKSVEVLRLIEEIGLSDEVVTPVYRKYPRYLYRNGALEKLPSGIFSSLLSPWRTAFLKAIWKDWNTPKMKIEDESIASFFTRHLGDQLVSHLIDPMVTGIYAGDLNQLSMASCFPDFWQMEQQYGSLLKGCLFQKRKKGSQADSLFVRQMQSFPFFSFKKGMATLTNGLKEAFSGQLLLNATVDRIVTNSTGYSLHLRNGERIDGTHLFSTIAPHLLAPLVREWHPLLSESLRSMEAESIAVVNFGYRDSLLKKQGFGYLIPSSEKESLLGMIWSSSLFPSQDHSTCLTLLFGRRGIESFDSLDKTDFLQKGLRAVNCHLGITQLPDSYEVKVANQAIPQYRVGHQQLLKQIDQLLQPFPSLKILGNGFHGVSIPACISTAKELAIHFVQSIEAHSLPALKF